MNTVLVVKGTYKSISLLKSLSANASSSLLGKSVSLRTNGAFVQSSRSTHGKSRNGSKNLLRGLFTVNSMSMNRRRRMILFTRKEILTSGHEKFNLKAEENRDFISFVVIFLVSMVIIQSFLYIYYTPVRHYPAHRDVCQRMKQ